MLWFVLLAVIAAATSLVIVTAPNISALALRIALLALVGVLWLPATQMLVDAFDDPLYRKDYIVGSVLMLWTCMFVVAVSVIARLAVLLLRRRRASLTQTSA